MTTCDFCAGGADVFATAFVSIKSVVGRKNGLSRGSCCCLFAGGVSLAVPFMKPELPSVKRCISTIDLSMILSTLLRSLLPFGGADAPPPFPFPAGGEGRVGGGCSLARYNSMPWPLILVG